MKKNFILVVVILSLIIPNSIFATPLEFSGGVNNEYLYEEIVFITGKPIKFSGTYKVSEKEKETEKTVSYSFDLFADDGSKYTKKINYTTELTNHANKGQTTGKTTVGKYSEKLEIDGDKYELEDYQFSKSDAIDNRAASDFYSGNIVARKYYVINKKGKDNDGEVIVDITGTNSGYENFWGRTETQLMDYSINSKRIVPIEGLEEGQPKSKEESWAGTVSFQVSDSLTKSLRYSENDAHFSSFEGGHVKVTNGETVSKYDYNLPYMHISQVVDGEKEVVTLDPVKRDIGTIKLSQDMNPKLERLIIPKFRDVNGHWAEDYIKKLYSLDVFDDNSTIFSPNTPMNRMDFTKAVVKACDIRSATEGKKTSKKSKTKEESYFKDISVNNPDYEYIKSAVDKGIVAGSGEDVFGNRYFNPNRELTRAEAVTILIKALGFENRAPNPGYMTSFSDDNRIPDWAKDSIYMAKETGLIQGDDYNRANSQKILSRAEGSTMVVNFLEFLEKDLQKDYRENIINFK